MIREDWVQYIEKLDYFFQTNGVTDAEGKRATLLTTIGPEEYRLITPGKIGDSSYNGASSAM